MVLAGLAQREGEALVDAGERRHVEHLLGRGDRRFIGGDGLARLAGHVMEIGPVTQYAGLQPRVFQASRVIMLDRSLEPLTGRVGVPKKVIDAPQPVVEVDEQVRPRRPLGHIDRLLDYRFGGLWLSLSEIRRGQDQLRAGSKLEGKGTMQHAADKSFGARDVAVVQAHLRFGKDEFERGARVTGLFKEIIDWLLQAAGNDP